MSRRCGRYRRRGVSLRAAAAALTVESRGAPPHSGRLCCDWSPVLRLRPTVTSTWAPFCRNEGVPSCSLTLGDIGCARLARRAGGPQRIRGNGEVRQRTRGVHLAKSWRAHLHRHDGEPLGCSAQSFVQRRMPPNAPWSKSYCCRPQHSREEAMRTKSRQIWSLMARRRSSHGCNEPNGRRDTVARANDLPSRFAQARSCRATTEEQPVELPLEHAGPEPKDSAQLCVAENERDRQESTRSARWNNYQQSKQILASSGLAFQDRDSSTTDCRRALSARHWRDPLNDRGIHRSTPNRRDRTGEGGRFQQVNLGNRSRVKSVEIRVILPA
jgi:hypothetical protein